MGRKYSDLTISLTCLFCYSTGMKDTMLGVYNTDPNVQTAVDSMQRSVSIELVSMELPPSPLHVNSPMGLNTIMKDTMLGVYNTDPNVQAAVSVELVCRACSTPDKSPPHVTSEQTLRPRTS